MNVPQSLLVAALVIAWLVVLVPSSSRRKDHVKQTVEGRGFRVLRRSAQQDRATKNSAHLRRRTAVGAGAGFADGEDEMNDREQDRYDEDLVADELEHSEIDEAGNETHHDVGQRLETGVPRVDGHHAVGGADTVVLEDRRVRESESEQTIRLDPVGAADAATDHDDEESLRAQYRAWRDSTRTSVEDHVGAPEDHSDGAGDDDRGAGGRPIPRRTGRGTYDPEAAERARAYKYARRRRTLLVLLLLTAGLAVASVTVSPTLWIATGVGVVLLVLFLFYLRRQVRIEADIRARRLAKLERARQIRPERRSAEALTDPYRVSAASQLPTAQRRSGGRVVVDLEDDDPGFDDLEYYEPVQYRRAVGQ